jgi:hypothetical protein
MTPEEMRTLLDRLGWSQNELARRLGRDVDRIQKMCRGAGAIDEATAVWLRDVVRLQDRLTHPPGGRVSRSTDPVLPEC